MKIFKHEGRYGKSGHHLGSCVIVVDEGLPNDIPDIVEIEIKDRLVVYVDNGDY